MTRTQPLLDVKELEAKVKEMYRAVAEDPHGLVHFECQETIGAAGLQIDQMKKNPYEFVSERAWNASIKYGVNNLSPLARKTESSIVKGAGS
ncbi:MAG: hypothetical protein WD269_04180 [Acidimicrobiia bacterium]